jgi:hypothetical protein
MRSLVLAATLLCLACDGGTHPTEGLEGACYRMAQCAGESPSDTLGWCESELSPVSDLAPDPDALYSCIARLSCGEIGDTSAYQACEDVNQAASRCNADDTLYVCTNASVCRDIPCGRVCSLTPDAGVYDRCMHDPALLRDFCFCNSGPPAPAEFDGGTGTPDDLCHWQQSCEGIPWSDRSMRNCEYQIGLNLAIVPSPADYTACIEAATCGKIYDQTTETQCADIDVQQNKCQSNGVIHVCSSKGVCRDVGCTAVCALMSRTYDYCGVNTATGTDVCWCQ